MCVCVYVCVFLVLATFSCYARPKFRSLFWTITLRRFINESHEAINHSNYLFLADDIN